MQRDIARELNRLVEAGEAFALATVVQTQGPVPGKLGFQMLVRADRSQLGTVGGAGLERQVHEACVEALASGESRLLHFDLSYKKEGGLDSLCGGAVDIFVHAVPRKTHVLLVGGGHINYEVAKLCDQLDFLHSVLDDRAEFASAERFPYAAGRFVLAADALGAPEAGFDPARFTHAVVAGYSYKKDLAVLTWLLPRFAGHVGLIGSAFRKKEFHDRLRSAGVAEERLASMECPVGLDLGAETPAEIAVSIVAGLVRGESQARRDGRTSKPRA